MSEPAEPSTWQASAPADEAIERRRMGVDGEQVAIDGDSIHRTYRGPGDKRAESTAVPATAEERAAKGVTLPGGVPAVSPATTLDEDAEKRASLLELT